MKWKPETYEKSTVNKASGLPQFYNYSLTNCDLSISNVLSNTGIRTMQKPNDVCDANYLTPVSTLCSKFNYSDVTSMKPPLP